MRAGVVPSTRHISRSATGDGLPSVVARAPVVCLIPATTAPDQPGAGPPLTEKTRAVDVASSGAPAHTDSHAARSAA